MSKASAQRFILAVDPQAAPEGLERAVVAIGNFDGIHLGHLAVIRRAEELARELGRPCAVLTFEPHPAEFFHGENAMFRLASMPAKARALERLGIDGMIVVPFDAALASLDGEAFIDEVLMRRLGVSAVVAGYDFHFGAGRSGTPSVLSEAGTRRGFRVEIVGRVEAGAQAASSTATRTALEAGDVGEAARLLGRPYSIVGEVRAGQKLGRTLGFPTANIALGRSFRLRQGIYAVRIEIRGALFDGVASFGRRPTVTDDGSPLLEIYVFDFSGDLYGETLEVFFIAWIRAEEKFESLEALKRQIEDDARVARALFAQTSTDV